jgi:hypothetical protein
MAEDRHSAEQKGEYDYEGDMAKSQLKSIITNAQRMHDMLEETTNLPEWVQSKITLAEDYILTATSYMEGEMSEEYSIQERINMAKAKMGDVIKDFYKSDAPQFAGRSKSKRRQMAIAAKLGAMRKSRMSEELKGNQHKIDANKNNKIDAQDFKLLRSKLKVKKEEASPMIKPPSNRFDNKKDAFAHAKKNGGKVYRHEYVNPRSGMKSTTFSVKEEVEQVNELKKSTLGSYIKKASSSAVINTRTAAAARNTKPTVYSSSTGDFEHRPDPQPYEKKASKRLAGISKAVNKMAKEEVEQVNELKKSTLGSYIKKASHDVATKSALTRHFATKSRDEKEMHNHTQSRKDDETSNKLFNKSWKRRQGIAKAVDRLAKEEVEQVDEVIGNTTGYSDSGPRNKADERKFHQMRNVVTKGPRTGKITKHAQNRLKDRLKTKTYMDK